MSVDLRGADLRFAHFCHADLMAADLTGAIMDRTTQWNGANLRNVQGLTPELKKLIKDAGGCIQ
jgi:uncharacterized protein YjbI with pentapeptide repeats